jgi:hypothetical protein
VPLAPGTFATVEVESVVPLAFSDTVDVPGGGVLAYDGERTTPVSSDATITVSIEPSGPRIIDVEGALVAAARCQLFDVSPRRKDAHGH